MKPWRVWGWVALAARGWLGPWVALAGLINEGMEEGETLARLGLGALAARGWLGPWVALAGLINEGMEEGETLGRLGLTLGGRKGLAGAVGRFGRTY